MKNLKSLYLIIKKLSYILNRKQKLAAINVTLIIIISSFFELLMVSAILTFIQAVVEPEILMEKEYVRFISKIGHVRNTTDLLIALGMCLMAIYILKNIFMIYSCYRQNDFSTKVGMDLSTMMLKSYLSRPYEYFINTNSAQILRGCKGDVSGVYTIILSLTSLMTEFLSVIAIGIFLIYTDALIAILTMILMMIVMIAMIVFFKPILKKIGKKHMKVATLKGKTINQTIHGIKELYVSRRTDIFLRKYIDVSNEERIINRTVQTLSVVPDRITEGVCVSGIIGIVCFRLMIQDDSMASFIPKLAVFAMAAFKIFPSVGKITSRLNAIVFQMPALDNVYDNMREANQYNRLRKDYIEKNGFDKAEKIHFKDVLEISNVSWKYLGQKENVLSDVSLKIKKGQSVGLIGPSGSGKTTLSDIILGLLQPQSGKILMDGCDVYAMPEQWANIVSYVPQNVFLIDDTVRNNVLFGVEENCDEKVWEALEQAQLKEFVSTLPNGLDTMVGERGVKFSGGQRQRIAIARALYNKPEILVLDEATAALDNETEKAVMEAVESLQGQITMIIVAHRLTTIKNCDLIFEIKNGIANIKEKEDIFSK